MSVLRSRNTNKGARHNDDADGSAQSASAKVEAEREEQQSLFGDRLGDDDDDDSSKHQPNAVEALKEQLRQQAEMIRQQQQQQDALLRQLKTLTVAASRGEALVAPTPLIREEVRINAVQPLELTYANATAGTALDDWLYKLDQLFAQTRKPEGAWEERTRLAQLHWDRHMALWWKGQAEMAAASGTPIASWSAFVAALRKHFVPTGDAEAARTELLRLRMRGGESMDAYMQRAVLIVARAGAYVDSKTAAALALEGVDKQRFPFTVKEVRRMERAAGLSGMTFAQMRGVLTEEAADEPQLPGRNAGMGRNVAATSSDSSSAGGSHGGSSGGGRHSSGAGDRRPTSNKQHRINALQQQIKSLQEASGSEGEADDDGGGRVSTAPISTGSGSRCFKCGEEGHMVVECKSKKELRSCHACKQAGHLRSKCPQRSKGRSEGEGAGAGQKPSKNE